MDANETQAVREYVVRKLTLMIDNTQDLYREVTATAIETVRECAPSLGMERDDFLMMLNGRGQVRRQDVAYEIGSAVVDVISGWVDADREAHGGRAATLLWLLSDLLDLNDSVQWVMLGDHFMPEAEEWPNGE